MLPDRITPASAGNTADPVPARRASRDHPCIRREHPAFYRVNPFIPGSPLHPQGTLAHASVQFGSNRITPASAGNTHFSPASRCAPQDHPCIRREHVTPFSVISQNVGSPLHPQGTHRGAGRREAGRRITPASAGNTLKKQRKYRDFSIPNHHNLFSSK